MNTMIPPPKDVLREHLVQIISDYLDEYDDIVFEDLAEVLDSLHGVVKQLCSKERQPEGECE